MLTEGNEVKIDGKIDGWSHASNDTFWQNSANIECFWCVLWTKISILLLLNSDWLKLAYAISRLIQYMTHYYIKQPSICHISLSSEALLSRKDH